MDWCPYCKKCAELRIEKIEMHPIKKTLLIYHCAGCGKFVKTEEKIDMNVGHSALCPLINPLIFSN